MWASTEGTEVDQLGGIGMEEVSDPLQYFGSQ